MRLVSRSLLEGYARALAWGGTALGCAALIEVARAFTKIVASVGRKDANPSFESECRWVSAIHRIGLFFVVRAISALSFFASAAVAPVSTRKTPSPVSIHEQIVPNCPYQVNVS